MTDAPLTPRETDEALAAEYVLGVQDLAERSATEARVRSDAAFAALVRDWEVRLAGMNDDFAAAPAPEILPWIEARLFPVAAPARAAPGFGLLRWLAGMAVAAVLVLAVIATLVPPRADLVAVLATADNRLAYEVRSLGDTLQVTRTAGAPAADGQVHQLWFIAPGAAPVSLGLLGVDPLAVTHPAPPEGSVLAVSVEPDGGSPTGLPTGPVILTVLVTNGA